MIKESKKIEIAEKVVDEKMHGNKLSWIMLIGFGLSICLIPFIIWGSTWFYVKLSITSLFFSIIAYVIRDLLIESVLKVVEDQAAKLKDGNEKSRFEQKLEQRAKEKQNKTA